MKLMKRVFTRSFVNIDQQGTGPFSLDDVYFLTMSNKMNILTSEMIHQLSDAY